MKKKTEQKPPVESFAERAGLLKNRKAGRRMLLYLSGAITNCPGCYRLKFDLAEMLLKDRGHIVINPAHDPKPGSTYPDFLAEDISVLTELSGYNRLLHGQLSLYLPNSFFPLPAVCIVDTFDVYSVGREVECRYANVRGIPTIRIETLVEDFGKILQRAKEEGVL